MVTPKSLRGKPVRRPAAGLRRMLGKPLLAILLGNLLFACGSAIAPPAPVPSGPTPTVTVPIDLPVVISLYGAFREDEVAFLDEQIARFEASNPDILVELMAERRSGDLYELMGQKISSGGDVTADIVLLDDAWLTGYAARGWLVPIDQYVDSSDLPLDAFFPGSVQAGTALGQIYALPWIIDAGLLYYRHDLLEPASSGVSLSWADIQSLALTGRQQKGMDQGFVWQGAAYESLTCNTLEYVWAYGGDLLDADEVVFDSPETRAALETMVGLIASGASPEQVSTYREGTALAAFRDGDAALMRNWPYAWERLNRANSPVRGQVGTASLPASCLTGQYLALSAESIYPQQALRFLRFLVDYDQQRQVALELGRPVASMAVYDDPSLIEAGAPFDTLAETLRLARPRPRTVAYPQISEAIYLEVHALLANAQGVAETAANVQRRIETILGQ